MQWEKSENRPSDQAQTVEKEKTIDILCKVVDNYGDIGVAYRLSMALLAEKPGLRIRLIIDNLEAFQRLVPEIDPAKNFQTLDNMTIIHWDYAWEGFYRNRPRAVIETFGCGFPGFYEELLFDPADTAARQVVDLEYLSAETWTTEYHLLPAPTRHLQVKKHMIMPGFQPGTGGLIHDRQFLAKKNRLKEPLKRKEARLDLINELKLSLSAADAEKPWFFLFTYEYNWTPVIRDIVQSATSPIVLVAAGRGEKDFFKAWNAENRPFPAIKLPFVPQGTFDTILLASDLLVMRGEESLARASLSGLPFLWQAYPLTDGSQREKVEGLLNILAPHLGNISCKEEILNAFRILNYYGASGSTIPTGNFFLSVLRCYKELYNCYTAFSIAIESAGDMTFLLLSFFTDFV